MSICKECADDPCSCRLSRNDNDDLGFYNNTIDENDGEYCDECGNDLEDCNCEEDD